MTRKDAYPLPRVNDTLDTLLGSVWFSTLDLRSGYWQVEVDPSDQEKTAFCMQQGLFEFNVMPFSLLRKTFDRHLHNLQQVLDRLRQAGLILHPGSAISLSMRSHF